MAGFELYEALLWEPERGYFLLDRHLRRLAASAARFRFALDLDGVSRRLAAFAEGLPATPRKVRLELSENGDVSLEHVEPKPSSPVRAEVARQPVDSADEFLRHKTSRRGVYERALAAHPAAQDVLLWNERGELTESCAANVVLELDGRRVTPHLASGLLPGTFREVLLESGEIEEDVVPVKAVERATRLFLVNSVRRWCPLELRKPAGR
jgi:branched-subunit amino acid aminotransferase/4-amino-4-deoxychorismate lyase